MDALTSISPKMAASLSHAESRITDPAISPPGGSNSSVISILKGMFGLCCANDSPVTFARAKYRLDTIVTATEVIYFVTTLQTCFLTHDVSQPISKKSGKHQSNDRPLWRSNPTR